VDKLALTRRGERKASTLRSIESARRLRQKPKTPEELSLIAEGFRSNKHLNGLLEWDDEKISGIAELVFEEDVPAGKKLILGKDDPGQYFYIVKEGSFEILIEADLEADSEGSGVEHVGMVSKGGVFGEVALICPAPRGVALAWIASEDSIVWVVEVEPVNALVARVADEQEEQNLRHVEKLIFFSHLKPNEKQELAKAMMKANFTKGDEIYKMGEDASSFYVLYSGVVIAVKMGMVVKHICATPECPVMLGELAFINDDLRSETIEVISDSVKTLTIDKAAFQALEGGKIHGRFLIDILGR